MHPAAKTPLNRLAEHVYSAPFAHLPDSEPFSKEANVTPNCPHVLLLLPGYCW